MNRSATRRHRRQSLVRLGRGRAARWRQGVRQTGKPIGLIALPERAANLCFGRAKRNRLFVAASRSIYSFYVNTQGARGG
jgi:sugar lactone lactonase YvrE